MRIPDGHTSNPYHELLGDETMATSASDKTFDANTTRDADSEHEVTDDDGRLLHCFRAVFTKAD